MEPLWLALALDPEMGAGAAGKGRSTAPLRAAAGKRQGLGEGVGPIAQPKQIVCTTSIRSTATSHLRLLRNGFHRSVVLGVDTEALQSIQECGVAGQHLTRRSVLGPQGPLPLPLW